MAEVEIPKPDEIREQREKPFTKKVALSTAVIAVVLAMASLGGNHATKEMLLAQQQSSDQWAYYQSKVIREQYYHVEKTRLEADLLERGATMKPKVRSHYESILKKMALEEARYSDEKKEIEKEARKLDHERDLNRIKDPYFDFAEALLQIAIVMASISILSVSRPIFYFAIVVALMGALLTTNGFFLFVELPMLH
ncbi:MAG: DUF4337 domain-containing protein [Dissulfurispiraceae bacterium]